MEAVSVGAVWPIALGLIGLAVAVVLVISVFRGPPTRKPTDD